MARCCVAVAVEALVVGVLASLAGLAVGVGLAAGLRALLDASGSRCRPASLAIDGADMAIAAGVGVIVTFAASAFPALHASRVPPLAAMRDVAIDRSGRSRSRAVVGGGLAAMRLGRNDRRGGRRSRCGVAGVGAVGLLVAMVLLGPVVATPASACARLAAGPCPRPGRLPGASATRCATRGGPPAPRRR